MKICLFYVLKEKKKNMLHVKERKKERKKVTK